MAQSICRFGVLTLHEHRLYCVDMASNKRVLRCWFSFLRLPFAVCLSPLNFALCLVFLPFAFCLHSSEARCVDIGIGAGIQSYPSSLDPYDGLDHYPVVYSFADMHVQVSRRISVTSFASRTKTENTLAGLIWCRQYVELYTIGFGLDYNFGSMARKFKLGTQVLTGFSDYTAGGFEHQTARGHGLRVYLCALQPLAGILSWGTRVAVQRIRIQILPDSEKCNLDSFHVDIAGYVSL